MTYIGTTDFALQVARGQVSGITSVNKFGASPDGIQTTLTDIWSRADAAVTQQIWLAPTAARVHAIVSTSTNDDGSPVGTGARTIRVYGLTAWNATEVNEDITMDGTTPVNTANSYVIIHRMKVLTCGTAGPNVGIITATAATDATVTAEIDVGDGQTEMAIYGVPSIKKALMHRWACQVNKTAAAAATVNFTVRVNENPQTQTTGFLRKNDMSLQSTGSSAHEKVFNIPPVYAGPCIIKIQGIGSAADIDASSGFDLELVDV